MSTPTKTVGDIHRNQDAIGKGAMDTEQPMLTMFILLSQATFQSRVLLPLQDRAPHLFSEVRL